MAKVKSRYVCQACGYETVKWFGHCPGCGEWNTATEEKPPVRPERRSWITGGSGVCPLVSVPAMESHRVASGIKELDRVLGGGVVAGSLILVGGDPGIGKSTLLLQVSQQLAKTGDVLYVSGEESVQQIKLRAERLGTLNEHLYVLGETEMERALAVVDEVKPQFVIIDSIQTVYSSALSSAPGSVSQIRECTGMLLEVAKRRNIATFIVGHVTKEGNLAGPRVLEHMVDAVLYFEGERHHTYRILRAVKNRFGSTNELAIFDMKEDGLREVANPSELFLSERGHHAPGSAVTAAMEGSRPLLVEVQALIAPSGFANPRRMVTGADYNRMCLILAVLERRLGLRLQNADAYVNIAGGVKVDEPAVDLGLALALVSSYHDRALPKDDVYIGEVGLTGEVRSVGRLEQRIREADKLGFGRCLVPARSMRGLKLNLNIEVVPVESLHDAMQQVM
ncbi:MAG: DNA repair protein RadA [Alicyclobacillus herbarius]|uniref:DNA repair protein RadA n=1 Tax=Alicyclobacillus herbarius TaxID=122960 RepID=UPI002357AB3A|nr:DNA repair protein RadA [Alicyclobacillus herbarius]MCL6632890.1 DNA repair protein RadA [Alicyclobacillus herbarius]